MKLLLFSLFFKVYIFIVIIVKQKLTFEIYHQGKSAKLIGSLQTSVG